METRLLEMSVMYKSYSPHKISSKGIALTLWLVLWHVERKDFTPSSKLSSRIILHFLMKNRCYLLLNLLKTSQYSRTEYVSFIGKFLVLLRDIGFCRIKKKKTSFFAMEMDFRSYPDPLLCCMENLKKYSCFSNWILSYLSIPKCISEKMSFEIIRTKGKLYY